MSETRPPSTTQTTTQATTESPANAPVADTPEDADALMPSGAGMSIWTLLIVSVVVHAVLLGVTSAGYLLEVNEYGTWQPDRVKAQLAEEQREQQIATEREQARAERADRERSASEQASSEAERREREAQRERPDTLENAAADEQEGDQQSPVEEAVTETSDERPTESNLGLEDPSNW
ncbi:MAG: hypothetical protein ACOC3G_06675 [Phycisphaeraceae bacterium]